MDWEHVEINLNPLSTLDSRPSAGEPLAEGWVTIEKMIRFPVRIRTYEDIDGKIKSFVSYPARRTENGYEAIICPVYGDARAKLDRMILNAYLEKINVIEPSTEIERVHVSLLDGKGGKGEKTVGTAEIEVLGLKIGGILIEEGPEGLAVKMPQHMSAGAYEDTVVAENPGMQYEIEHIVLWEYQNEKEIAQGLRKPYAPGMHPDTPRKGMFERTPHPYDAFLAAAWDGSLEKMVAAAEKAGAEGTIMERASDGSVVSAQAVMKKEGRDPITLVFGVDSPAGEKIVQLLAFVPSPAGGRKIIGMYEYRCRTDAEFASAYDEVFGIFAQISGTRAVEYNAASPQEAADRQEKLPCQGTVPSARQDVRMTQPRRK